MFRVVGAAIRYTWPLWLIGWVSAFVVLHWTAPPWEQVAQDREFGFLPDDAPTRQGQALFKLAFPDDKQVSNIVIVLSRADMVLQDADRTFISDTVKPALIELANQQGGLAGQPARPVKAGNGTDKVSIVAAIRTPDDRGSGALLLSDDRQAALVVIELTTELLEERNWPILQEVEALIARWRAQGLVPVGLSLDLIGSATVGRDMIAGQRQSAQATEFWTILIAIIILVLIYRAPFLAMIPLISVFMATQIAMKMLAHLSNAGIITVFEEVQIYITVILYGTGIDYCLFLIARYQEECEKGSDWGKALADTIGHVGPALAASAATVIFGIGMMVFARFGKFHHAGIAVALCLAISLCVVLTFTTSLLRLGGRVLFWPRAPVPTSAEKAAPDSSTNSASWLSWDGLSRALLRQPALIWLVSVLLMSPLAVGGLLYADRVDYDFIARLPADAPSVAGTKALQDHFPAGIAGTVTVLIHHPHLDFLAEDGKGQIELSVLTDRIHDRQTRLELANVRSWSRPLGWSLAARNAAGAPLEEINRGLRDALHYYTSDSGEFKGHVTRMELTMYRNPLSLQGIATLDRVEDAIRSELYGELRNAKLYFLGTTADMRDLREVTRGDQTRTQVLVTACVLAILIVLLRRPVVSIYLVASVLFSYFATLGATVALFWSLDPEGFAGLDWKVPIFLFTILVAIGEDYNIFLMTRVEEEQEGHGAVDGVRVALVRTGRIITSCGIIMAGTFASLLSGSMQDLRQLGFALAFGVLVDTFVVRPILVPAFLILLERGRILWRRVSSQVPKDGPA